MYLLSQSKKLVHNFTYSSFFCSVENSFILDSTPSETMSQSTVLAVLMLHIYSILLFSLHGQQYLITLQPYSSYGNGAVISDFGLISLILFVTEESHQTQICDRTEQLLPNRKIKWLQLFYSVFGHKSLKHIRKKSYCL